MEIRLILGDQLNANHSWFKKADGQVIYLMMEILPESEYVTHHIQKICAIFSAMRKFRDHLVTERHQVVYFEIDDPENRQSFEGNIQKICEEHQAVSFAYMEPDEYRLDQVLNSAATNTGLPFRMVSSEHFMTGRLEIREIFAGRRSWVMEHFYRTMRSKHNILMESVDQPEGGQWNYDHDNRKKLPKDRQVPPPQLFHHDISGIYDAVQSMNIDHIGEIRENDLNWPLDRSESLQLLDYFCRILLSYFGDYQDALTSRSWSLFHSRLSFSLNTKMLNPVEVIEQVIRQWKKDPNIPLNSVEGFIRQILGWREYIRGMYWHRMPAMSSANFFGHERPLPVFYWTGNTKMACMKQAIGQSLTHAYAHHIQRLMITGNFALLAGTDPAEVDAWYLGVYADAFEWVELPNTRGMSQYANGGMIATKPYISSAAYIRKMSDHCSGCKYDPGKKTGSDACPFNSLYWHFLERHRPKLEHNPRMTMMYRVWDKMKGKEEILAHADDLLENIHDL